MSEKKEYKKLINAIIQRVSEIVGKELTIRLANEVQGLEVSEEGTVQKLETSGKKVLKDLTEKYQEIAGGSAVALVVRTVTIAKTVSEKEAELEFPDIIEERL